MIKSFKKYLKENVLEDTFNAFVEESFGTDKIDTDKASQFELDPDFTYTGEVYRLLWIPDSEIANQNSFKNIARHISNKYLNDPKSLKFFYKSVDDAYNSKVYALNTENKTGIIFHINTKNSLDLSKYTGNMENIKERINNTNPVLDFEPMTIDNIDAKLIYDQYSDEGWVLYTSDTKDDNNDLKDNETEEKTDDELKNDVEQNKDKPTSGISNGQKHSKYPHSKTKEKK